MENERLKLNNITNTVEMAPSNSKENDRTGNNKKRRKTQTIPDPFKTSELSYYNLEECFGTLIWKHILCCFTALCALR